MSIINSFLQKRKMHETHHGIVMVVTAYVLSFLMLVLGSDVFYNINSKAAGKSMDTDEEIIEMLSNEKPDSQELGIITKSVQTKSLQTKLINPYGLTETTETGHSIELTQNVVMPEDTIWLMGFAMNGKEYDDLMGQMDSFNIINEDQTKKDSVETIESFSVEEDVKSEFMDVTKEEITMLERIVEAEATGEDMKGKILIANVIFNRIAADEFPDTVKAVIFQKVDGDYQFSPVSDERYWSIKVTKKSKEAVVRALQGEDYSEGALYFMARKRTNTKSAKWFDQHLDWLFKHGGHEFYKNK